MRFSFKTLEKQLEESGFEHMNNVGVYEWQTETFSRVTMEEIGKKLEEWQRIKKLEFEQVFLRIRPRRKDEQIGNSDYRKEKVIEIYVPK